MSSNSYSTSAFTELRAGAQQTCFPALWTNDALSPFVTHFSFSFNNHGSDNDQGYDDATMTMIGMVCGRCGSVVIRPSPNSMIPKQIPSYHFREHHVKLEAALPIR